MVFVQAHPSSSKKLKQICQNIFDPQKNQNNCWSQNNWRRSWKNILKCKQFVLECNRNLNFNQLNISVNLNHLVSLEIWALFKLAQNAIRMRWCEREKNSIIIKAKKKSSVVYNVSAIKITVEFVRQIRYSRKINVGVCIWKTAKKCRKQICECYLNNGCMCAHFYNALSMLFMNNLFWVFCAAHLFIHYTQSNLE